jgi:hypothetical protein
MLVFMEELVDVRMLSVLVYFVDTENSSIDVFDLTEKIENIESVSGCPEAVDVLEIYSNVFNDWSGVVVKGVARWLIVQ